MMTQPIKPLQTVYCNIGCSESKVIFKWRNNNNKNKKSLYKEQTFAQYINHLLSSPVKYALSLE